MTSETHSEKRGKVNVTDSPTAPVFDIARFALHDGPGIRTTVFLKGCRLRCAWCHNPEAVSAQPTLLFTAQKCTACGACVEACPQGVHTFVEGRHGLIRERCVRCGACVHACFDGALEMAGREMSVAEVLAEVARDIPFYKRSGGGMTVSGGEPLTHHAFIRELFGAAKARGLHTALDTSGFCPWEQLAELVSDVDLFLYDVKHTDPETHRRLTGVSNEQILENLRRLNDARKRIWIRVPLVPGLNDDEANYHAMGRLLSTLKSVERVEILRYHRLAECKYERMGRDYPLRRLEPPSEAMTESRRRILESRGLPRVVWR